MCMNCGYEKQLEVIDDMLDDTDLEFAMDTICDIQGWVLKNKHITDKQKIALENIRNCKGRFDD